MRLPQQSYSLRSIFFIETFSLYIADPKVELRFGIELSRLDRIFTAPGCLEVYGA